MISQSSMIAFFLLAAFVIFITQRGSLPTYMGFLLSPSAAPAAKPAAPYADLTAKAADLASTAAKLAKLATAVAL